MPTSLPPRQNMPRILYYWTEVCNLHRSEFLLAEEAICILQMVSAWERIPAMGEFIRRWSWNVWCWEFPLTIGGRCGVPDTDGNGLGSNSDPPRLTPIKGRFGSGVFGLGTSMGIYLLTCVGFGSGLGEGALSHPLYIFIIFIYFKWSCMHEITG